MLYLPWHIEVKFCTFCILLCFYKLPNKFEYHQIASNFVIWSLFSLRILKYTICRPAHLLNALTYWAERQIKFRFRLFASSCIVLIHLFELRKLKIHTFFTLFSYMLWLIELKICMWICFNDCQIRFEYHQFASKFEEFKPFYTLQYWIYSFMYFSRTSSETELNF